MPLPNLPPSAATLFSHVTVEKMGFYRAIMDMFASAKRQFRLHLRPDEVLIETHWPQERPSLEEVQAALGQLVTWGNLQSQADTARAATIEDYYRKHLLYRMTAGGEAVEASLQVFTATLARRGELQSVALEDIRNRLSGLRQLAEEQPLDVAKIHEALRDLVHVFEGLAANAEAFMSGLARTIDLQRADVAAVMGFKSRLIDYLERFIGDLVTRSSQIGELLRDLEPSESRLLAVAAAREARDAAPGTTEAQEEAESLRLEAWRERWAGLRRWFSSDGRGYSQSELLRKNALAAIPRLLQAVSVLNDRRAGRSDRAADFRRLAIWFWDSGSDANAHRLGRAAFGLSPARHLALTVKSDGISATTSWKDAPAVEVYAQLREQGVLPTRGAPPKIRDRSAERELLAAKVAEEHAQTEAARQRLATGKQTRLSELGLLDKHAFRLFLTLLGEALASQTSPESPVERQTGDGTLVIQLQPLEEESEAIIETELGRFAGRDYRVTIRQV
jgi:uncharacterized protein (TIGR02677 family)